MHRYQVRKSPMNLLGFSSDSKSTGWILKGQRTMLCIGSIVPGAEEFEIGTGMNSPGTNGILTRPRVADMICANI